MSEPAAPAPAGAPTAIERLAVDRLQAAQSAGHAASGMLARWRQALRGRGEVPADLAALRQAMGPLPVSCRQYLNLLRNLVPQAEWESANPPHAAQCELLIACVLAGVERFVHLRMPELVQQAGIGPGSIAPMPLADAQVAPLVLACLWNGGVMLGAGARAGEVQPLNVITDVADPELRFGSASERFRAEIAARVDVLAGQQRLEDLTRSVGELAARGVPEDEDIRAGIEWLERNHHAKPVLALHAGSAAAQQVTQTLCDDLAQTFGVPLGIFGAASASTVPPDQQERFRRFEASVRLYLQPVLAALHRGQPSAAQKAGAAGPAASKPTVFLSYAHADDAHGPWVNLVRVSLSAPQLPFELWDDKRIRAGEQWHPAIQGAIERADVAVVLVSGYALSSSYIVNEEFSAIKKRHEAGLLAVRWLVVEPCHWPQDRWLDSHQAAIPPDALSALPEHEAKQRIANLVGEIHRHCSSAA